MLRRTALKQKRPLVESGLWFSSQATLLLKDLLSYALSVLNNFDEISTDCVIITKAISVECTSPELLDLSSRNIVYVYLNRCLVNRCRDIQCEVGLCWYRSDLDGKLLRHARQFLIHRSCRSGCVVISEAAVDPYACCGFCGTGAVADSVSDGVSTSLAKQQVDRTGSSVQAKTSRARGVCTTCLACACNRSYSEREPAIRAAAVNDGRCRSCDR